MYKKDEYLEEDNQNENNDLQNESGDDFELLPPDKEEIPDFLKDEELVFIDSNNTEE